MESYIIEKEIVVKEVNLTCQSCEDGFLTFNIEEENWYSNSFCHKCNKCGHKEWKSDIYPHYLREDNSRL